MRLLDALPRHVARSIVRTGFVTFRQRISTRRHVILTFHRVRTSGQPLDPFDTCPSVTISMFREILKYLVANSQVLRLGELADNFRSLTAPTAAITFDDGWRDNYDLAFPVLQEFGLPATIFVTTGKIGSSEPFWQQCLGSLFRRAATDGDSQAANALREMFGFTRLSKRMYRTAVAQWKKLSTASRDVFMAQLVPHAGNGAAMRRCFLNETEMQEMARGGIDFGSHTVSHSILTECRPADVASELADSKAELERIVGSTVDMLAYPNGGFSNEILNTARDLGYRVGCTTRCERVGPNDKLLALPRIEPPWDHPDLTFDEPMFRWRAR